jgi:hypothetical protein
VSSGNFLPTFQEFQKPIITLFKWCVYVCTYIGAYKGGHTLVTLPRTVMPYRDIVDGTCDHIMHQKLVMQ